MNVNGINAGAVNWEVLLSSLGNVEKTGSADGKTSFTITTKVGDEIKTTTLNIPDDLDIPENVDKGTLQGLVDKLAGTGLGFTDEQIATMKDKIAELYGKSAAALSDVSAKSKGSVLFDLYALMSLMIDVAQSQRDAARDMRTAQNMAIQKSIQDQADKQHDAAMVGMIFGIVCGAASALVSIGTMVAQGVTVKQQNQIMSQSGADSAKMHSAALQNTDTAANAQTKLDQTMQKVGNEVSTRVGNDFEAQLVDDQVGNLSTNLDDAIANHDAAKQEVLTKQNELQDAKTELTNKQSLRDEAQRNYDAKTATVDEKQRAYEAAVKGEKAQNSLFGGGEGTRKLEAAKAELDSAKQEQATAKTQLDTAKQNFEDQKNTVANIQRDLNLANTKLTQAEANLTKAKSDYVKTVQDVAAQYEEKYMTAVDRLNNPPEGSNKAQLKADVAAAKADMEMAYAKEAQLLTKEGALTPSEQKDLVATARARVDTTMDRATRRADFKAAEQKMSTLMGINNINQAIGGVLQSTVQNISANYSADATRQGAETQKQEEMLDQTKDLFQQEQKLIDQVVQLFSAVIQAESQSMRDAIQA